MHALFQRYNNDPLRQFAISAWLTSQFNTHYNYYSLAGRDCTRFLLFTSIWTIAFSSHRMFFDFPPPDSVLCSMASHISYVDLLLSQLILLIDSLQPVSNMGLLDCGRFKYHCHSQCAIESQVGTSSYYSSLALYLPSTQSLFVYCGQLIALEVFAWVILYV